MNWSHDNRDGVDILTVGGYLGNAATDRFAGAAGWVLAHATGPILFDLSGLRGWSDQGERAVLDTMDRLHALGCRVALCGMRLSTTDDRIAALTTYPDLNTALQGLASPVGTMRPDEAGHHG
ncbi:hypothetical protein [Actinacidiphila glaucinigra]|uniref:hypothetical protein n=1 Tax=Actinacidiphila glaucinigra TaxID=235986 RepID=UPI0035D90577